MGARKGVRGVKGFAGSGPVLQPIMPLDCKRPVNCTLSPARPSEPWAFLDHNRDKSPEKAAIAHR